MRSTAQHRHRSAGRTERRARLQYRRGSQCGARCTPQRVLARRSGLLAALARGLDHSPLSANRAKAACYPESGFAGRQSGSSNQVQQNGFGFGVAHSILGCKVAEHSDGFFLCPAADMGKTAEHKRFAGVGFWRVIARPG